MEASGDQPTELGQMDNGVPVGQRGGSDALDRGGDSDEVIVAAFVAVVAKLIARRHLNPDEAASLPPEGDPERRQ